MWQTLFQRLFLPLFLIMPVGQMLAWKRGSLLGAVQRLIVACLAGLAAILILGAWHGAPVTSVVIGGLAVFTIVGAISDVVRKIAIGGSVGESLHRAIGLPRSGGGQIGGGLVFSGDAALFDPGAAYDPGAVRRHHFFEIGVGQNFQRRMGARSKNDGCRQNLKALLAPRAANE